MAKVLEIFNLDEQKNELKLKDQSGKVYYTEVHPDKCLHICKGMVVRIRSCLVDWYSWRKNNLVLKPWSNIMSFISSS